MLPSINIERHRKLSVSNNLHDHAYTNRLAYAIIQELDRTDSTLGLELEKLTDKQKIKIITGLLSKNQEILKKQLLPLLSHLNLNQNSLMCVPEHFTKHDHNNSSDDHGFNPIVSLISHLLKKNGSVVAERTRNINILQNVMQQIPDFKIHIKAKVAILREIDLLLSKAMSDLSYHEPLTPLANNRFSGKISPCEFATAIQIESLDTSEYLMLALGLLQGALTGQQKISAELNEIRQLFLEIDYKNAINKIRETTHQYSHLLGPDLTHLIIHRSTNLSNVEIGRNYSRRFFENRLSQLFTGLETNLNAVSKISQFLVGRSVHTMEEVESAILSLPDYADASVYAQYTALVSESPLFQLHDRSDKLCYSTKGMECQGLTSGEVYTKNKGILPSNAPNFYDELSIEPMRNKVVDTVTTFEEDTGYSFSRPESSLVASLSGHTYLIVAMLEQYMLRHTDESDLQTHINLYIKSVIAVYLSHSYHSLLEVTDVFRESNVQEVFSKFNVVLDLSWCNEVIEKASYDTQEYTKTLCLKKAVNTSLNQHSIKNQTPIIKSDLLKEVAENKKDGFEKKTQEINLSNFSDSSNSFWFLRNKATVEGVIKTALPSI